MNQLGKHAVERYITGTKLGTSDGLGWEDMRALRLNRKKGELGKVLVRGQEVIVLIQGSPAIRRSGECQLRDLNAVAGMVWLCPDGVSEDMLQHYGDVEESIHLYLPESLLSRTALQEVDVDFDKLTMRCESGIRDPLIEQIAWAIRAEMIKPELAGKMMVESLALALGVHLIRNYSNLKPASAPLPAARGALEPRRYQRVIDFIETNLGEYLTIEALANEACLSPFHFARAFKAATGVTPHAYLTERRNEKAKSLIAEGRVPFAEIAFRCGFSSQAYFTTWFKRNVGVTPGAYRMSCL